MKSFEHPELVHLKTFTSNLLEALQFASRQTVYIRSNAVNMGVHYMQHVMHSQDLCTDPVHKVRLGQFTMDTQTISTSSFQKCVLSLLFLRYTRGECESRRPTAPDESILNNTYV